MMRLAHLNQKFTTCLSAVLCALLVLMSNGVQEAVHSWVHPDEASSYLSQIDNQSDAKLPFIGEIVQQCWLRALLGTLGHAFKLENSGPIVNRVDFAHVYEALPAAGAPVGEAILWRSARGPPTHQALHPII
jgi:hypothetical protein